MSMAGVVQEVRLPGPKRHSLLQASMQALRPGLIRMEASRNKEKVRHCRLWFPLSHNLPLFRDADIAYITTHIIPAE